VAVKTGRHAGGEAGSVLPGRSWGPRARRHAGAVRGEAAYRLIPTINCLGRLSIKLRDRAYQHRAEAESSDQQHSFSSKRKSA